MLTDTLIHPTSHVYISADSCRLDTDDEALAVLDNIAKRVLWLSTMIVHHANNVYPNEEGTKVGGHQASSASVVSLMTALYFHWLRRGDRVSVKPHASPAFHAIQMLLGNLPPDKLEQLRSYKGLQAYPSRTKDPDPVDFSTGSIGLGAVIPNFAALTQEYVHHHFGRSINHRFVALIGDAELDEGNIWEALGEETLSRLGNVVWIVDLNRQSLDRAVPSGKAQKIMQMFLTQGWYVIELKYGRRLQAVFEQPHGYLLRQAIDDMTNVEYQTLLTMEGSVIRRSLVGDPPDGNRLMAELLEPYSDGVLKEIFADLGGHDMALILESLAEADRVTDRPVVIIAYTIKGWGLPFAGDPLNHSALLTMEQIEALRASLQIASDETFVGFDPASPEGRLIAQRRRDLAADRAIAPVPELEIPNSLGIRYQDQISTQQAFGQLLLALSRLPGIAERLVTTSPDVAISTNLGGWINKIGVYHREEKGDYFERFGLHRALRWSRSSQGQHIELGIAEMNLFLLLTALGLSHEFTGELLLPVGTIYDCFISRGLDALRYAVYSEAKFIFVGTPSGITLSPEGGAHQSILSPAIGLELPNLVYYEPTFAHELEWILLAGLRQMLDREHGQAMYLRLSTRPVDQTLLPPAWLSDSKKAEQLRQAVLSGGYWLLGYRQQADYDPQENVVNIFVTGVMVPEAVAASRALAEEGLYANVIVVTSPDRVYRDFLEIRAGQMKDWTNQSPTYLERLVPPLERKAPIVTVVDGHPHLLAFLGGALGTCMVNLGVRGFGQSGTRTELYDHYEIGPTAIQQAVWRAVTLI